MPDYDNRGDAVNNKQEFIRTEMLETREPFSTVFPIQDVIVKKITEKMKKIGFDPAHPIIVWMKDKPVVLDGHTRLQVALSLGIEEVPVILKEFNDVGDALDYAVSQQIERRNITIADMLRYIQAADQLAKRGRKKLEPDGSNPSETSQEKGKSSERLAKVLNVSVKKAERLRRVAKDGTEDTKRAMCDGEISVTRAYEDTLSKCAAEKSRELEAQPISPEEQLKLAQTIRLKSIPDNIIAALEKEIKSERAHYPALYYTEKQIAVMKTAIIDKLDDILNQLA